MTALNPSDPALQSHFIAVAQHAMLPNADQRRAAEAELKSYKDRVDVQHGFVILLLQLCANQAAPDDAKSLVGTFLKNLVRDCWDPSSAEHLVQDSEKEVIRQHVFDVMKGSPSYMQRHLAEVITLIAAVDFPNSWSQILQIMIAPLTNASSTLGEMDVALSTAHSVFVRYRKLDELTEVARDQIITINAAFTKPLLNAMTRLTHTLVSSPEEAVLACKALTTACEVLYDLICFDMGDEHEQNLDAFMNSFLQALQFDDARLRSGSAPLIALKSSVLSNVTLFVQRFDEEFDKYARTILQVIWEIVASSTYADEDYDDMVISGLEVLSAACRGSTRVMLGEDSRLRILCDQTVLPNLSLSESDVEAFDDSASDFIEKDVEGSDLHTRRRAACELIRALLSSFPEKAGQLFMSEVSILLQRYQTGDWKAMDTAIYLVTALALEGGAANSQRGAKQTLNANVPFDSFLQSTILPEFASAVTGHSHPIIKADTIRFIATFRNHIDAQYFPGILQHLQQWLSSKHEVLYSYSVHCLERLLTVQELSGALRISAQMFEPVAGVLLSGICGRLAADKIPNPYAMRCLMRIVKGLPGPSKPFVGDIIMCLNGVLGEAAKNPSNPVFNHCLFEVISSCIAVAPEAAQHIESALWECFVFILSNDVVEFTPYVLQVMAQLLDTRPAGPLPDIYRGMAAPLVAPTMYEHKGTIPAVVRMLNSMIKHDPAFLHEQQLTEKILGVFRTLVQLKQHDHEGLSILTTIILHYPKEIVEQYLPTIYSLLFQRLSTSKTPKFIRILIIFFSILVIVYGAETVVSRVNAIQQGLFWMLLTKVWLVDMQKVVGVLERKVCVVALAALLCDSEQLKAEEETWFQCVYSCLKMIHGAVEHDDVRSFVPKTASLEDLQQQSVQESVVSDTGFSNVYCPLQAAVAKAEDPIAHVHDANGHFRERLHQLVAGQNGQVFVGRLQTRLAPDLFALIQ
ncbi:cellular apoptosis susceptibility-domain protein, putative [Bodo saltans]|uniref:Cellular apoptosis susceptibility-domain protein, putative n=1 Tax=Bodo saltans TaxID=75058 RepID=A0A0S4JLP3_BODSA|nr:cellular apoptosis susceptibility-domain protein, putative [Bodo saltans]|eukprot:CUG91043.1 cellular apoptosis susceptibility-domain protein, putative [Bodo saltans]